MFTPYLETILDDNVKQVFTKVKRVLALIPDISIPDGRLLSCHIVARLVSRYTEILFKDGFFGFCEHSWLEKDNYIIDVYPIGALEPPLLLDIKHMLPWENLYRESNLEVVVTEAFKTDCAYCISIVDAIIDKAGVI